MGLKFTNRSECPPGEFRFKSPETGIWFQAIDFPTLVDKVRTHYLANNLPVGLMFEETIEDQACKNTDPSVCRQLGYGSSIPVMPSTYEQVVTGTKVMMSWLASGFKRESPEEVNRRSVICVRCNYNTGSAGCPSCGTDKIKNLIASIVNDSPAPNDPLLFACRVCGCALQAKVKIPMEILKKNEPEIVKDQYPDWCWMKT